MAEKDPQLIKEIANIGIAQQHVIDLHALNELIEADRN